MTAHPEPRSLHAEHSSGVRNEFFVAAEYISTHPRDAAVYYEWLLGLQAAQRPGDALLDIGVTGMREPTEGIPQVGWVPVFRVASTVNAIDAVRHMGARHVPLPTPGGVRDFIEDAAGVWTAVTEDMVPDSAAFTNGADYSTRDVESTTAFAEALLGARAVEIVDDPYSMRLLTVDGHVVGGVFHLYEMSGFTDRPLWIVYFGVDDLVSHLERAVASGSRVLIPPTLSPLNLYAVLEDPWGEVFGLGQMLDAAGLVPVVALDDQGNVGDLFDFIESY